MRNASLVFLFVFFSQAFGPAVLQEASPDYAALEVGTILLQFAVVHVHCIELEHTKEDTITLRVGWQIGMN